MDLDRPKWFAKAFDAVDWRLTLYENGKVGYDDTIRGIVTAVTQAAGADLANGERVEWCEEHRVETKVTYVKGYDGPRECQDAPYFEGDCRIVSKFLVDHPEEGTKCQTTEPVTTATP